MSNTFDVLFIDAVEGLAEFYPVLRKGIVHLGLRLILKEKFVASGDGMKDYEALRDRIEKIVDNDEKDVVGHILSRLRGGQSDFSIL